MAKSGFGAKLKNLFTSAAVNNDFYDELEDLLIEGDIGAAIAMEISDLLKKQTGRRSSREDLMSALKEILKSKLLAADTSIEPDKMNIFMVLGVNGVGKTTTIAKLAEYYRSRYGAEAILSAGDTFRAAAIDQLKLHGERLGLKVVHQQPGSDPGAVIYDSIESALARGTKLIIADTAGRMHNKANLVKELQKIDKIINSKASGCIYRKILVIDATTGQNGFRQAELFNEAVDIDQIILTKYDSNAKGGIAVSISSKLGIPFSFIGTGEKYSDLLPFDIDKFVDNMLENG